MQPLKFSRKALALSLVVFAGMVTYQSHGAAFVTNTPMNVARQGHTATLLQNGKVLVVGGATQSVNTATAELYDPATRTWTFTGSLITARRSHTATLLNNGQVLVVGGVDNSHNAITSVELFDPSAGAWTVTNALAESRRTHTATLLTNGMVLVAGGYDNATGIYRSSSELFNPTTGAWAPTGLLTTERDYHTATLLQNGTVLVAGGEKGVLVPSAELYDPIAGIWTSVNQLDSRYAHQATLLTNGRVLITGGIVGNSAVATALLYDPQVGGWSFTDSLKAGRNSHTATLLSDGTVLVAGGWDGTVADSHGELYNPSSGLWSGTVTLNTDRLNHTATLLPDGNVLIAGGQTTNGTSVSGTELYDPSAPGPIFWTGAVSTDWNDPANWDPQQVPTSADRVVIDRHTVIAPTNAAFAILDFSGGNLFGSLMVASGAVMNWSSGEVNGALTVASNAVLNIQGHGVVFDNGTSTIFLTGPLTNAGTVNWSATGYLRVDYYPPYGRTGAIYNLANGVFDCLSQGQYLDGKNAAFFDNAGTVRKPAGSSGTTILSLPFNNSGIVESDTGVLSIEGGFSCNPSAKLAVSLGGATAGTDYGRINFYLPPTFNGTFSVSTRNGYRPNPGDSFQVLTYPSSTNTFTCLSGLDLGSGILLQPQYSSTSLTLLAKAYSTNSSQPQLFINQSLGGVQITWPVGFPGWTLQTTTNLAAPVWTLVSITCGNQTFVPTAFPQQFFRLSSEP